MKRILSRLRGVCTRAGWRSGPKSRRRPRRRGCAPAPGTIRLGVQLSTGTQPERAKCGQPEPSKPRFGTPSAPPSISRLSARGNRAFGPLVPPLDWEDRLRGIGSSARPTRTADGLTSAILRSCLRSCRFRPRGRAGLENRCSPRGWRPALPDVARDDGCARAFRGSSGALGEHRARRCGARCSAATVRGSAPPAWRPSSPASTCGTSRRSSR